MSESSQQLDYTIVRAPFSGVIGQRHVQVGETIAPGQPIFSMNSPEQLRVRVSLPQSEAAVLEKNRTAKIVLDSGKEIAVDNIVVFPDAELKLFLIADPGERARRRYTQLSEKNLSENKMNVSLAALEREIAERDARDMGRAAAPLTPAADAKILDTTHLSIAQVCEWAGQQARPWR